MRLKPDSSCIQQAVYNIHTTRTCQVVLSMKTDVPRVHIHNINYECRNMFICVQQLVSLSSLVFWFLGKHTKYIPEIFVCPDDCVHKYYILLVCLSDDCVHSTMAVLTLAVRCIINPPSCI